MNKLINENLTDFDLLSDEIKNTEKLYERFLGYANTYDEGRPKLPSKAIELLKIYFDNEIETIVDIGCGTGLSTEVCTLFANNVIGIEPSIDMLKKGGIFAVIDADYPPVINKELEKLTSYLHKLSQSSMQHAIKYNYDKIIDELNILDDRLHTVFKGQTLEAIYPYKMRIGIK